MTTQPRPRLPSKGGQRQDGLERADRAEVGVAAGRLLGEGGRPDPHAQAQAQVSNAAVTKRSTVGCSFLVLDMIPMVCF